MMATAAGNAARQGAWKSITSYRSFGAAKSTIPGTSSASVGIAISRRRGGRPAVPVLHRNWRGMRWCQRKYQCCQRFERTLNYAEAASKMGGTPHFGACTVLASQKLALRASEIHTRLTELAGTAEQTDETRSEIETLRNEYRDIETRYQAALTAEDDKGIETRSAEPRSARSSRPPWNTGRRTAQRGNCKRTSGSAPIRSRSRSSNSVPSPRLRQTWGPIRPRSSPASSLSRAPASSVPTSRL